MARECHHRAGRARGAAGHPAGHASRPQAHQGARARVAAQGPRPGRDGGALGAVKKVQAIFNMGEGE